MLRNKECRSLRLLRRWCSIPIVRVRQPIRIRLRLRRLHALLLPLKIPHKLRRRLVLRLPFRIPRKRRLVLRLRQRQHPLP